MTNANAAKETINMTTRSRTKSKGNRMKVEVDGATFTIQHVSFDSEVNMWRKFSNLLEDKYGVTTHKSSTLRLLITAVAYELIELDDLETKVATMSKNMGEDALL